MGEPDDGSRLLERSLIPSGRRLSQILLQDGPFILRYVSKPRRPFLQQECQRLHCSGKHLFRLTPFRSILRGKENGCTTMRGHDPVTQGALQGEGSALPFQLIEVYKIPGEGSGKLLEIVEGGPSQNSSPSIMLWSGCSELIVQPSVPA